MALLAAGAPGGGGHIPRGRLLAGWVHSALLSGRCCPPGKNLSCYQCFKVRSPEFCLPAVCSSTDRVCVSHVLIITLSEFLAPCEGGLRELSPGSFGVSAGN